MMKINSTRRKFKFSTRITMKNEWILLRVRDQVSSETSQSRSSRQETKTRKKGKNNIFLSLTHRCFTSAYLHVSVNDTIHGKS